MPFKTCFCSIAFRDEPIEAIIDKLADMGYDGVEIFAKHIVGKSDEELLALKKHAEAKQIAIEVISPYFWFTNTQELYDQSIRLAEKLVRVCRILDCPKIRTFTDCGPTGIASAAATDEHWERATVGLKTITAMDRNIRFVLEMHALTLADTVPSALKVLDRVDAENLKLLFHAPDFDLINDFNTLKPHVEHMHLQNTGINGGPGFVEEGTVDLRGFMQHLSNEGYSESVSVEYCFEGATWERARSALDHLSL